MLQVLVLALLSQAVEITRPDGSKVTVSRQANPPASVVATPPEPQQPADPGGFQKAHWGATTKQVRSLFPRAVLGKDGWLTLDAPLAGFGAATVFHFAQDKLKGAVASFKEVPGRPPESVFIALGRALNEKYGDDGDPARQLQEGMSWHFEKTTIRLRLELIPRRVTLTYASVELAELEDQVSKEQAKDL